MSENLVPKDFIVAIRERCVAEMWRVIDEVKREKFKDQESYEKEISKIKTQHGRIFLRKVFRDAEAHYHGRSVSCKTLQDITGWGDKKMRSRISSVKSYFIKNDNKLLFNSALGCYRLGHAADIPVEGVKGTLRSTATIMAAFEVLRCTAYQQKDLPETSKELILAIKDMINTVHPILNIIDKKFGYHQDVKKAKKQLKLIYENFEKLGED